MRPMRSPGRPLPAGQILVAPPGYSARSAGRMPAGSTFLLFATASLALLAVPGPAVIDVVTRSLDQGRPAGIVSVLGVETGTFAYALAAAAGLTGLIAASEAGFTVVKDAGAAACTVRPALHLRRGRPKAVQGTTRQVRMRASTPAIHRTVWRSLEDPLPVT